MSTSEYPKKFKVYTASAGAGKTFRLSLDYLKIALREPSTKFRSILAITFTVKATNEMKARILEACKAFSRANMEELTGRNAALLSQLQKEVDWTIEEIAEKASILYKTILHNYSDFAISTIDSFSQRIIRSFAYDLGKPINFDIELDSTKTADYLTAKLLSKVGAEDQNFTELMVQFFEEKLKERDSIFIQYDIQQAIKIMFNDESFEPMKQLEHLNSEQLLSIGKAIQSKYYSIKKTIQTLGKEATDLISHNGLEFQDFRGAKRSSVAYHFNRVQADFSVQASATFEKAVRGDVNWFSNTNGSPGEEFERQLSYIGSQLIALGKDALLIDELQKAFPRIAMLVTLRELFTAYQNEEEFLLISEFNKIISEQVQGQPAPFLYERVGERYEHILIDEFQDTSIMQWHNLVPLVVESLDKAEENESLVVGDSKQAIYRWRGGETKQLTHLPKLLGSETDMVLQDSERTLELYFDNQPMEYNFRSREEIVHFNNTLFEFITNRNELSAFHSIYNSYFQKASNKNSGGYIRADRVEKKSRGEETETYHNRVFEIVEDQLKQIENNGYSLHDVAILCRNNKELVAIAEFLQAKNIRVSSKESLRLQQEKAIAVFPSLVEWLAYPHNQLLQAEIVNFFVQQKHIQKDAHFMNKQIGNRNIKHVAEFAKLMNQFAPDLKFEQLNRAELLPLWEQFVSWLPQALQNSSYVSFFRDELWNFVSIHGNNMELFVEWWKEQHEKLFIKTSDASPGIQLLTIHKAKGLEFEVVMMPFANWKFSVGSTYGWVSTEHFPVEEPKQAYISLKSDLQNTELQPVIAASKQDNYLDNLNLLYVATTRAVSELYFIVDDNTKANIEDCTTMSQYLNHFFEWNDANTLEFGSPTTAKEQQKEPQNELILQQSEKEFGQVGVAVNNRASVIWNDEIRGKIDYGSVVHSLLEHISTVQDISPVLYQAVADGLITDEQQAEFQQLVAQVVEHKELAAFFSGKQAVFAEQGILTPDGKEFIPDRMVINEETKTVQLVDFKTGSPSNHHQNQLNHYAELLEQMNYTVVEKKLVYLQNFEIVSL